MSELIDRIFDAEKISAEINTILQGLKSVEGAISGVSNAVKTLEGETRKAKSSDDLAASSEKLNNEFAKGQKAMKTWEDEVAKLNEKTRQLTETEKQGSIEIAKARLELQAAQKATKDAAIAEIELTAKNKDLAGSYNALQKDLKNSIAAYKALSGEEAKSAKGRELLQKIGETQTALKKSDAAMGNYQRNVGNYASALEGLTPKIGGLAGTLLDIAKAAKENKKGMDEMSDANNLGIQSMGQAPKGLSTIIAGFKGLGQTVVAVSKALLANPIGVIIAAIVGVFALMKKAIDSNGEATRKLGQVLAPFKTLLGGVMNVISKVVTALLDGVLAFGSLLNAVMSFIPGLDKLAEKNKEAIALEKEKQRLIREGILDKAYDAKEELRIAELKKKIMQTDKYSKEERLAMAREIDRAEKAMALDDANRANLALKNFLRNMKLMGKTQKDFNEDELKQLVDLQTAKYNAQQTYFDRTKKLASREANLVQEINTEEQRLKDEAVQREKERVEKTLAARRRLIDSQLALMKDSEEKSLAISREAFNRQIEDLKRNGELTTKLKSNLLKIQLQEEDKIRKEWSIKRLNDDIKADELILSNMQRAGENTLSFQKELLKKRMEAEILAGGDELEIRTKYQYLQLDLENEFADKKIQAFQKEIEKQSEILTQGYKLQEIELKKQFSKGLISREKYESELSKIHLNALLEVNNKQIESLQKLLADSKLTDDKRAEFSKQLADLQIANENAVVDATIKANEDKIQSDKDAIAKRIEVAQALADATGQIFGAIADYAIQQSEQRIASLEKEQEVADKTFEDQQSNLDNAIMSDENRALKQKQLNEKKAAQDKALQDKIQAEKIKQAKWEKANAIVQAIISAGLAVLNATQTQPFIPLGLIAAGLATTMGAIQIAAISSQQIPAYAEGTQNHPGGLSLWGEKQPEVAVTPSGETFLAEKPTLTTFDAGTKIYKSVSDYENFIAKQAVNQMVFDYDKMGEKMKPQNIVLDSRGLWGIVSKQGSRQTMINRRYKIG